MQNPIPRKCVFYYIRNGEKKVIGSGYYKKPKQSKIYKRLQLEFANNCFEQYGYSYTM